jgi:hypothetical protein
VPVAMQNECPLWVKSRHLRRKTACPLYSQERTCAAHAAMSALGHKRTFAPQTTSGRRAPAILVAIAARRVFLAQRANVSSKDFLLGCYQQLPG